MQIYISKIRKIFVVCIIVAFISNCKKDEYQQLPEAPVDVTLSIVSELSKLGVGSAIYCPKKMYNGYKGIILYRSDYSEFKAFERLCTNFPNDTSAVNIDESGIMAICPICSSKFELIYGGVVNGPAKYPLKEYQTSVNNNFLYIRN